ncbi:unnamed protein product [Peronospora destructor]|uniref:Uncharacterized protein n=1 Tax=Peronospora destructor TaxID=86335 RepID=A0AAV0UXR3_9STRA|nr:unnamed protein product [Peronospora destructor]
MQPGSAPSPDVQDETQQARDWWSVRELEVERELDAALQRRMEAQRRQLYAFKTEQSKWEHELQLRISKYAHDRKLLSEDNREMDQQVEHVIELEGMLHENQIDVQQIQALRQENEELQRRLRQWETFYRKEKVVIAKEQKIQQEELLTELEKLLAISEDELVQLQHKGAINERETKEDESLVTRIKELEATCKQKDQTICSLKTIVEQQETVFDEKVKILTAKYDQVKTINMVLQVGGYLTDMM